MDLESCFITIKTIIRGNGEMEINMEEVYWLAKMVVTILVNGKMMWLPEKEYMSQFAKTLATMANG